MGKIAYKTALCNLQSGEKPCYRAVAQTTGSINLQSLAKQAARKTGLDPDLVRYSAELFLAQVAKDILAGRRVEIEDLFSGALSVAGTFDSENEAWDPAKHRLVPHFNAKGEMRGALGEAVAENMTEGNHTSIKRVLDTTLKTNGVIASGENILVYVSGLYLLVNPEAEDEGCWLENEKGEVVARASIVSSTQTTLDARFAQTPEPGRYKLAVASRGGLSSEFGVSIARKNIEVRTAE